jgi:hypothetical protein
VHVGSVIRAIGKPLGLYGEQELEALHQAWWAMWDARYMVKKIDRPSYPSRQNDCALDFNSTNSGA